MSTASVVRNPQPPEQQKVLLLGPALAAPWVSAEARDAIAKVASDAVELRDQINAVEAVDTASASRVTELLTIAATFAREVEAQRRRITDPLKRQAKEIEDAVRPVLSVLDQLVIAGKAKVVTWQRAERERVERERQERERLEREAVKAAQAQALEAGGPVAVEAAAVPPPVADAPRGIATDYGTAAVRTIWKFEVVDQTALPEAFKIPNEKAIGAAVRAGARHIPGVRIYPEDNVAVTAR